MQEGAFPEDLGGLGDSRSTVDPGLKADTVADVSWAPQGTTCLGQQDANSPKSDMARASMRGDR